ncbi:MAG: hypothetical protein EOM20_13040 [Spartobacteria bacterium]|nr:hypothetical protein [Spartobacteria bacterium]
MKKNIMMILLTILLTHGVQGAMLVNYDFGGPSIEDATLNPTYEAANIDGHAVVAGPALTSVEFKDNTGGVPPYYSAENWESSLHDQKYFQFAVTVTPGFSLDVASLSLSMFKKSGKGPDEFRVRYSLNGTTFTDFGGEQSADYEDQWHNATVVQSLAALSGTVFFRIYGYGANAPDKAWRLDNLTLNGVVYSGSTNPPSIEINPIGMTKTAFVGERMEFQTMAIETDGDIVTLTAEGVPADAVFTPDPSTGPAPLQRMFYWTPPVTGACEVIFTGADKDGTNRVTVSIEVLPARPEIELILNEASGVSGSRYLGSEFYGETNCADSFFGRIQGNGGNWMELVVVKDHADLRGWKLCWAEPGDLMSEAGITNWAPTGEDLWYGAYYGLDGATVKQGVVTFSEDALWGDLRAGTIITIIESEIMINESGATCLEGSDPSIDIRNDDWWIHISTLDEAGQPSPRLTTTSNISGEDPGEFVVGNDDWELMIMDDQGRTAFMPVGEGVETWNGGSVSSVEGLFVTVNPQDVFNVTYYDDTKWTTFGAPNVWDEGGAAQDFGNVRSSVMTPPGLESLCDWTAVAGREFVHDVEPRPTDGDGVFLQMTGGPVGSTFTTNASGGTFQWTPSVAGEYFAVFAATDQDGTESQSISIFVVEPPMPSEIVINELFVNPVGTDDNREYIELKGPPGASLNGLTLLMLDSAGEGIGDIELVCPLTGRQLGGNGFMILGKEYTTCPPYTLPADTARMDLPPGTDLRHEGTYLLVQNFYGSLGDDLDDLDAGSLDYTPWSLMLDSVGMAEPTEGWKIYSDARLMSGGYVADACSRLPGNSNRADVAAWYYGATKSVIGDPWGLTYDPGASSTRKPDNAMLTPGAENHTGHVNQDSDGDGLPDDWELQMFGSLEMNPNGDYDGDNFSNYSEYIAGTHANDSNSVFEVYPDQYTDLEFIFSWDAITGRIYSVQYCNSLNPGTWTPISGGDNISVASNQIYTVTNGVSGSSFRVYRVTVQRIAPKR